MSLDSCFTNKEWCVKCETVGDVIEELRRLPKDMPVHQRFKCSVDIVVFNRDKPDCHVGFEEGGEWTEDEDDI